ncbi:MAG: sensor histidine kinase [Bacteroidota bacterium]
MKYRIGQVLTHIFGCVIFLAVPLLFAPDRRSFIDTLMDFRTQREFTAFVLLIVFFYVNFLVLIPRFYFNKRYPYFFLCLLGCYLVISFLPDLVTPFHEPPDLPRMPPPRPRGNFFLFKLEHHFIAFAIVFLFSLMLRISSRWKQAERERLNAELSYLKAQINPHFLFNTLNSIYSLAVEKSDHTAPAVVKLSGMMRYVIGEADKDRVPLKNEIAYIQSYIELQQIRFGDAVRLDVSILGETEGKQIAPLLLIPFVENAFKHGVNAEEDSRITIRIVTDGPELSLEVLNAKVTTQHQEDEHSGLGIANTRNRLQLLYPGRHQLTIEESDQDFLVLLKLQLI